MSTDALWDRFTFIGRERLFVSDLRHGPPETASFILSTFREGMECQPAKQPHHDHNMLGFETKPSVITFITKLYQLLKLNSHRFSFFDSVIMTCYFDIHTQLQYVIPSSYWIERMSSEDQCISYRLGTVVAPTITDRAQHKRELDSVPYCDPVLCPKLIVTVCETRMRFKITQYTIAVCNYCITTVVLITFEIIKCC